jgi:CRISPR-associated protein Csx17
MSAQTLILTGCQTTPLAGYLKALGVLRIVAEQHDPAATGRWTVRGFELRSTLDLPGLVELLAERWAPTPILCPWNGDSGFHPEDGERSRGLVAALAASEAPRCAALRAAICAVLEARARAGLQARQRDEGKIQVIELCRAWLPDEALAWLDAAVVLLDGEWKGPPLLGSGGNDGRLDFGVNFLERLTDLFDAATGEPTADAARLLRGALTGEALNLGRGATAKLGQLDGGRDGANPWDYVLAFEGTLLFAAAAVRRLGPGGSVTGVAPFTVEAAGAGYGSASPGESGAGGSARGELWLPVWEAPLTLLQLRRLFADGRIDLGRRAARDGLEVARALGSRGVDRGIVALERFGLLLRNGKAYLAVSEGRHPLRDNPAARLLDDLDQGGWRRSLPRGGAKVPGQLSRAVARLDEACFALCEAREEDERPAAVQAVLVALGELEAILALGMEKKDALGPCPPLGPGWVAAADDGTPEVRLAASLASLGAREGAGGLRLHLTPCSVERGRAAWDPNERRRAVWRGSLEDAMLAVLQRRALGLEGAAGWTDGAAWPALLSDVASFLMGQTDDARLEALVRGLALVDASRLDAASAWRPPQEAPWGSPPLLYALTKLCYAGHPLPGAEPPALIPLVASLPRLLDRGDAAEAARVATRRLRGSGLAPVSAPLHQSSEAARRIGAALLFPLAPRSLAALTSYALVPTWDRATS